MNVINLFCLQRCATRHILREYLEYISHARNANTHFTTVPAIHSYECLEKQQLAQVKHEIVADTHQNIREREKFSGRGGGLVYRLNFKLLGAMRASPSLHAITYNRVTSKHLGCFVTLCVQLFPPACLYLFLLRSYVALS